MRRAHQSAAASPPAPPSLPLPGDPDVTGTCPPPPPRAARAAPGACRRARAASRAAQPGPGRGQSAPQAARDAPPARESIPGPRATPAPSLLPHLPPTPCLQSPPSAPVTARRVAEPESSRPPHCTTRLPNCLHRLACECVCVYSVSHREAEEVEEKEKEECTGRDRCSAHTHSHSVTLSERVALAHTRPQSRSAQDPGRRGKVAPASAGD